jgi:hypothetical protein
MSWNAPQTLTEAIHSVELGLSFQSRLGVKGEPIWVLTDITRDFPNSANDEFAQDLIRRNWNQRERYMTEGRKYLDDDLVYVVGRDGALLVGMLRSGELLVNVSDDLTKKQRTFRAAAIEALHEHKANGGHLNRYED